MQYSHEDTAHMPSVVVAKACAAAQVYPPKSLRRPSVRDRRRRPAAWRRGVDKEALHAHG
eukprot:scaffold7522_cov267-Pinguiococcus_pyrenoidosus.AAC.1